MQKHAPNQHQADTHPRQIRELSKELSHQMDWDTVDMYA